MSRVSHIDGEMVACDNPACGKQEFVAIGDVTPGWLQGAPDGELAEGTPLDACGMVCSCVISDQRQGVSIMWKG